MRRVAIIQDDKVVEILELSMIEILERRILNKVVLEIGSIECQVGYKVIFDKNIGLLLVSPESATSPDSGEYEEFLKKLLLSESRTPSIDISILSALFEILFLDKCNSEIKDGQDNINISKEDFLILLDKLMETKINNLYISKEISLYMENNISAMKNLGTRLYHD